MSPTSQFILAIDVGNTRIKCGLLERTSTGLPHTRQSAAISRDDEFPWPNVFKWIESIRPHSIPTVIAGSHPERIQRLIDDWPIDGPSKPHVIESASDIAVTVNLPEPAQVGIDRLLNAVAANRLRPDNRPAIIIDCGTATTVDMVSAVGAFAGGAILPGLELSSRALQQYTARLPLVDVADLSQSPPRPLGQNTQEAIQSGLFWGQVGAVRELVSQLSREFADPFILTTGGGGESLTPYIENARYEPHLSLQGLVLTKFDRD